MPAAKKMFIAAPPPVAPAAKAAPPRRTWDRPEPVRSPRPHTRLGGLLFRAAYPRGDGSVSRPPIPWGEDVFIGATMVDVEVGFADFRNTLLEKGLSAEAVLQATQAALSEIDPQIADEFLYETFGQLPKNGRRIDVRCKRIAALVSVDVGQGWLGDRRVGFAVLHKLGPHLRVAGYAAELVEGGYFVGGQPEFEFNAKRHPGRYSAALDGGLSYDGAVPGTGEVELVCRLLAAMEDAVEWKEAQVRHRLEGKEGPPPGGTIPIYESLEAIFKLVDVPRSYLEGRMIGWPRLSRGRGGEPVGRPVLFRVGSRRRNTDRKDLTATPPGRPGRVVGEPPQHAGADDRPGGRGGPR